MAQAEQTGQGAEADPTGPGSRLVALFARHQVAANLTMAVLVLAGVWGIHRLNTQIDPDPEVVRIRIVANWPGAAAEDLERLVAVPIENRIRSAPRLERTSSVTRAGSTRIEAKFEQGVDISAALDDLKQRIAQIRNLPDDLEPLEIRPQIYKPHVASVLVTGPGTLDELIPIVRDMERELLQRGVDEISFAGLPREEIAIEVDSERLREVGLSLDDLATRLRSLSRDVPAGTVGRGRESRQLRSLEQRRDTEGFLQLPVRSGTNADGPLILLRDIATVIRRPVRDEVRVTHEGRPGIEMNLLRMADTDLFDVSRVLRDWVEETRPTLSPGVELFVYKESWRVMEELTSILARNALSGIALVIAVLFVFLSGQVARWVVVGIPVSFMGAMAIFYLAGGGSISIVMLLTLVMAFGIVVDDAIVVGEDALAQHDRGAGPLEAAIAGARRMLGPVAASSITTMAAFIPILIIGEAAVNAIPLTMCCVILASLLECFLVLPGHLHKSFARMSPVAPGSFRSRFDAGFARFRDQWFRPLLERALARRAATLTLALAAFSLALTLVASGRVGINLALGLNLESVEAMVEFRSETSREQRHALLRQIEDELRGAEQEFADPAITTFVTAHNTATFGEEREQGEQYASVTAELTRSDLRDFSGAEFARAWRERTSDLPGIERLQVRAGGGRRSGGPDLTLTLSGADVGRLKAGAEELADALQSYPAVADVGDNLPYGKSQWLVSLSTEGRALGLSADSIGRQLHSAYEGQRVQLFDEDDHKLEVRVMLAEQEQRDLASLKRFPVWTPTGEMVPLASVAEIESRRGIDVIRHADGLNAVSVSASVDPTLASPSAVIADLQRATLPAILERHGLRFGLGGRSAEDARLLASLSLGAVLGLALIYIVLAWIFASYTWPLAIMAAIPLGLTGVLFGHWVMGRYLSPMSILGIFTLTGIVVNDSIVLVTFYRDLRTRGIAVEAAIVEATCQRLRAVILTSLTTVAGLLPLIFERSPIASYLTPMAITIVWGMSLATALVVFVIPTLLSLVESASARWRAPLAASASVPLRASS